MWGRFLDRSRRARRRAGDLADVSDPGCGIDGFEALVAGILALILVLFVVLVGIPFLIALGELVFVVVLALVGLVSKVLFRRPWIIDAVDPAGRHHEWPIVGWRASGAAKRYVAERVTATGQPPGQQEVAAAVAV